MDYHIDEHFGSEAAVDLLDYVAPHERKVIFQRRRGDIYMQHPFLDIAAEGVAVDTGSDHFGPHIRRALLHHSLARVTIEHHPVDELAY